MRMETLATLKAKNYTHKCPKCSNDTYCAVEDGKTGWSCWCMNLSIMEDELKYEKCLCKECIGEKQ